MDTWSRVSGHFCALLLQNCPASFPPMIASCRPYMLLLPLLFLLGMATAPVSGQVRADDATTLSLTQDSRIFRIGFLRREETGHPDEAQLERFRDFLNRDPQFQRLLEEAGFSGIGLYSADGAENMRSRMASGEFDLAFSPANIFFNNRDRYTAVLKARRPDDIYSPPPREYVRRYGVVFVSPRSPLFHETNLTPAMIQKELNRQRLALVSTQSVSGFHAPLVSLNLQYGVRLVEGGYLWFESSEEVVKAVLSGLADIGACEKWALDQVLKQAGLEEQRDQLIHIILETDPVVTDPVALHRSLYPRGIPTPLGRAIVARIRSFSFDGGFGDIQYLQTSDADYRSLGQTLNEFDKIFDEVVQ